MKKIIKIEDGIAFIGGDNGILEEIELTKFNFSAQVGDCVEVFGQGENTVVSKGTTGANDSGNFGWGVLGCCFPIVGLILFLVWNSEKPKNAKAAGIGALIATAIIIIFYILMFALGIGLSNISIRNY